MLSFIIFVRFGQVAQSLSSVLRLLPMPRVQTMRLTRAALCMLLRLLAVYLCAYGLAAVGCAMAIALIVGLGGCVWRSRRTQHCLGSMLCAVTRICTSGHRNRWLEWCAPSEQIPNPSRGRLKQAVGGRYDQ